jgi:hypothetical protein
MLRIIITLLFIGCFSNTLRSELPQDTNSRTEFKIPLKNISSDVDNFITELIHKINSPRIIYKNGEVIFYPDPDVESLESAMKIIGIVIIISTLTVVLIPLSIILLIAEICLWYDLSTKKEQKRCLIPYVTMDDTGITIKNQKIFWGDICNISKEEISRYVDGTINTQKNVFHFYNKYLKELFDLQENDDNISSNFDTLITILYYYIEKSGIKLTQNVQRTTISSTDVYLHVRY